MIGKYISCVEKIENQLIQVYSKYYGQCDEEMKSSMREDASFERINSVKDVIALRKILKTVNCKIVCNKEPFKTLWKANKDFIDFKQLRLSPNE